MGQRELFGCFPAKTQKRPSGPHQAAVDGWTRLWEETRGSCFAWTPRALRAVKTGLALAGGDPQLFLDRARDLLFDPPTQWYAQNASPCLLASKWNELSFRIVRQCRDTKNAESLRLAMEGL